MRRLFAGDRAVWVAAALTMLILGPFLGYHLLRPTEHPTGSTTAPHTAALATIEKGQTLCQEDVPIPDGTGRLQFHVHMARQPRRPVEVTLRAGRQVARGEILLPPGLSDPRVKVEPEWRTRGDAVLGDVCVRAPREEVVLHGWPQRYPGDGPLTVDGRPVQGHLSIWFVPPYPTFESLLGLAPEVMDRASLFRPAPVGAWTYWTIFFVALPLVAYLAIRALAQGWEGRRALLLVAGAAVLSASAWALATPQFNAPDEHVHFAYTEQLARNAALPERSGDQSPLSSQQVNAIDGQKTFAFHVFETKPPWADLHERQWSQETNGGEALPADNGGGPSGAAHYGPLYYASLVPAYWAGSGGETFGSLTLMRLWSALLAGVVAVCGALVVRELLPRWRGLWIGAGLLLAMLPTFAFVSGSVNNDTGVNALAAVVILLLVRTLCRGLTRRRALALAVATVGLPFVKTTGLALYPAVAFVLAVVGWRRLTRSRMRARSRAAVLGAVAVVSAAAAWFVITQEAATPATGTNATVGQLLSYLWQTFLPTLGFMDEQVAPGWPAFEIYVKQALAVFGWTTIALPEWVYEVAVAVMALAAASGVAALWSYRGVVRAHWPLVVLLLLVPLSVVAGVAYAFAPGIRPVPVEQGRYIFPALVALAALLAGCLTVLGRRGSTIAMSALTTAMIALSAASFAVALATWYA